MTKMSDNPSPSLLFADTVDPAAPSSGFHRLFIDTDEKLKMIDHASLVTDFTPGGAGLSQGSTFPGSPTKNDLYFRNDLNQLYKWTGSSPDAGWPASKWLCTCKHRLSMSIPDTNVAAANLPLTAAGQRYWGAVSDGVINLYITDWIANLYLASNSGTNYWDIDLKDQAGTVVKSFSTAALANTTWLSHIEAVDALSTTAVPAFNVSLGTKHASAGAVYLVSAIEYHEVAT